MGFWSLPNMLLPLNVCLSSILLLIVFMDHILFNSSSCAISICVSHRPVIFRPSGELVMSFVSPFGEIRIVGTWAFDAHPRVRSPKKSLKVSIEGRKSTKTSSTRPRPTTVLRLPLSHTCDVLAITGAPYMAISST